MDLLKIITDPEKINYTCFLCYHCDVLTTGLYDKHEIHDEHSIYNITLWHIVKELFPTYDFLLTQACKDCTNLIIKIFLLLQRNYWNNKILSYYFENISDGLDRGDCEHKKLKINIKIPTFDNLLKCKQNPEAVLNKCNECQISFQSQVSLKKHVKLKHKNVDEAIICEICGKLFKKPSTLKTHLGSHKEEQCPYCSKLFKSHSHFNLHVKSHKQQVSRVRNKKYSCGDCNYKTLNKTSLEAHINRIHLNIRPYVCNICQKGFYKNNHLVDHRLLHQKIKDNVCELCGDSFVSSKTLKEHLRLHSGDRPYKCKICNSSFVNSGRRYEHVIRKHGERNLSCEACGKKFGLKKDLKSHIKKVHMAIDNLCGQSELKSA